MNTKNLTKAFIVDDDPFWTGILSKYLEELGIADIETMDNGIDCLEKLNQNPDVIFLDYQMENINGIEVLQKIKTQLPNTRVIFCTAHEDLGIAVNAIQEGSYDYLLKMNANKKEISKLISNL